MVTRAQRLQGHSEPEEGRSAVADTAPPPQDTPQPVAKKLKLARIPTTEATEQQENIVNESEIDLQPVPVPTHSEEWVDPLAEERQLQEQNVVGFMDKVMKAYYFDEWFANSDNVSDLINKDNLFWKQLPDGEKVLVIPNDAELRKQCIQEVHDNPTAGHFGIRKTYKYIARL
eukprot:jgi/Chrzof1/68/Cz01g02130.t1